MRILIFLMPIIAFAGGSGHGSPSDLISSFVNVAILGALLLWKVGPVAKEHFLSKSEEVEKVMNRAQAKAKEADALMKTQTDKLENADSEIARLEQNAKAQIDTFKTEYEKDVDQRIANLKTDAEAKIAAEKKSLSNSVNQLLVDKVVNKSKETIKSDKGLAKKSSDTLLEAL
ncbi:MAG: hypothetical protein N4A33_09140 [Bacteriovoracaceae bacterium]|nr:hypothetical protein [Bacteriovoracaceae bacterium]